MSEKSKSGLTLEQLEYLFRIYHEEVANDHLYDAWRALAWYTGWSMTLGGDLHRIDREDGAFSFWKDKPFIEMTEEEYKALIGEDLREDDDDF